MRFFRNLPTLALFALLYVAAGKLGLQLAFVHANASAVWPPTGIAIAGALLLGYRIWPAIFIGAFVVNITTAGNVVTSLGIAMGNTLEALVAAWLVNRFAGGRHAFDRAQDVFKYAGLAAIAATMVSATIGAGTLALAGFAPWSDFGLIWRTWWLGDAGGALVVAPLLLSWAANPRMNWDHRRSLEFAGVLFLFVLVAVTIFAEWFVVIGKGYPLLFPLLPLLLWIGFRFGQRETATAVFALAIVAVTGTLRGLGPFSIGTQNESLLALQAFLGTMTIMSMTLTAAISERRRSEQRLEAQQATTRILAESQSLSEAMPRILEAICKTLHWEVGNYWTVNSSDDHLECAATWPEQNEALAGFIAVSKASKFRRGIGMPGRVWESGRVAWIEDVVRDPNFPRAPIAESTGLHSAFGFPLSSRGRVFGVVEFFTREFRASKQKLLAMAAATGGQIAQFVERKEAERAMIQNEALYRTMAETASDAFLTVDESGTILFANRAAEQTFGFEVAEMIGRELAMLMPGGITGVSNVRPSTGDLAARTAGGRSLRSAEVFGRDKSGHIFPLEISIGEFEEDGRRICTVIARDISERKQTEKMLAQHACIVELSNDAIYSKSIEGIITSWNKAAERLYGYTAEEILGQDVLILVPPEYVEEERQILARVGSGERIASYETVRRHKEQRLLDISLTVSPIRTDGEISGLSAIARDVTEQKRAAAELERQKIAAEAANQAKDNFLAMLSHELRTPLSPVVSAIDHLEPKVTEMPELQEAIAVIRRNIEHEARLIDDLLDLTRVVKGKLELRREVLDTHQCILDALEPCRAEIAKKRIVMQTEFRAMEYFVNADRTKLQQIIWNLVKNAVKFSREGGAVSIVTENEPAELLVVHVRDSGIGIEPEMLRRIFNPFEQGERSIQRRYGGLGLGLAVSKALAEAHGGTLTVASEGRDTGAAFTLRLDLAPAAAVATRTGKTEPSAQRPGRELRILLVEDHEDTRHSMERLLRRRGYHVESANSVGSAIELAAERTFDLVISDIGLPDNSGFELMRRLQQLRPIKGIAVSGFGMEGDLEKSRAAGFSDHLLKPVNFNDLEAAIWNVTS